jgi:hypothetical protein
VLFGAFEEDFYSCVAPVPHVTCQTVLYSYVVDEGAKTYALNYARNVNFNAQWLTFSKKDAWISLIRFYSLNSLLSVRTLKNGQILFKE